MAISHAQLKAFHAVAVYGSFTLAAERLFLSQPAISDQVKKLEDKYDTQLFIRNKRKVVLTDAGASLLMLTEKMFATEAEVEKHLLGAGKMTSGSLRLAVDSTRHLANYITMFCERYPGISVSLLTGNSEESLHHLTENQVDAAVIGRPFNDIHFDSVLLTRSPIMACLGRHHPLSSQASLSIKDLHGQPLVLREQGSATRRLVDETLQQTAITNSVTIEVVGREAVNDMVANGIGIGFISQEEFNHDPRLLLLPIDGANMVMDETLICLKQSHNQRVKEAFMSLVKENRTLNLPVDH